MTAAPILPDYDSPWKEIIELYFPHFMLFFFPSAHAAIDWHKPYTFLDKELQQVVREAETGNRRVDKLVKVFLLDGQEIWVLIHIEVQGDQEETFAERMYIYNYRIFDKYKHPVASLAILTDDSPAWRPNTYRYEVFGCQITLNFPIIKLLDYKEKQHTLTENSNIFAVVVMAHLQTQATRRKPRERYAAKLALAKLLYQRGYGRSQILELFRFIDWIMTLPQELERQFEADVIKLEEESKMRYVTNIERFATERGMQQGMQQGVQQGVQQGMREGVVNVLMARFESVPDSVLAVLKQIETADLLRQIQRDAVLADSLHTFEQQLQERLK